MIITIDGPAGTGKSAVAKRVAEKLDYTYFDTGALYRAFAFTLHEKHISLDDDEGIASYLPQFAFTIEDAKFLVNDQDVTSQIRTQTISQMASQVGAKGFVRKAMNPIQKDFAKTHHSVFEGRDLGTVVFPDASLKVFLTADV